ncbi:molybdopterin-dependent oxidoreductase [Streptomyces sp. BI20]|uniref:molybdopterin-dependent oxidoreductase n=1 Tax=Streptomyces sp. BI20 TaxID=3403460 RepID=UPI003C734CBD
MLAGLAAAFAGICAGELLAPAIRPQAGPITAVGGALIDATPIGVKDWAVRTFGTADKPVLLGGILLALAAVGALAGLLAVRRPRPGIALAALIGLVGAGIAVGRPGAGVTDALPSLLAGAVAAGVLALLTTMLRRPAPYGRPAGAWVMDRRGFHRALGATVLVSAAGGLLGRRLSALDAGGAIASRDTLRLPAPASPAGPVPAGADLRIPGVGPFTTPARDFYRVDTALVVPKVDARTWRLTILGDGVTRPLTLTLDELLARPLVERDITLTCVSNEVGGPYIGNARWLGVPLADLLREAGVKPPSQGGRADQLVARSVDGMTLGSPVETVMDGRDALLAVGMNGAPLPFEHGFPVRMVVPGLYGYVSACKWLRELRLTTFDAFDAYWVKRSWSPRGPIKTETRIDTPRPFADLKPGRVPVAGVAWAQHRGIEAVEVRVDGGPWRRAKLGAEDGLDTWRQWVWWWDATPGGHTLEARSIDRTGAVQTGDRVGTVPDGATGWHSVVVNVTKG